MLGYCHTHRKLQCSIFFQWSLFHIEGAIPVADPKHIFFGEGAFAVSPLKKKLHNHIA